MSKLRAGETPSTRRLQARAAKSALRRAQQIYGASANAQEELDAIQDRKERDRRARELRRQAEEEIQYLANRLSELLPTDMSLGDRMRAEELTPNDFIKVSPNEYRLLKPRDQSSILDDYRARALGDAAKRLSWNASNAANTTAAATEVGDDEFVKEWMRRSYGYTVRGNQTEDDEIETALA